MLASHQSKHIQNCLPSPVEKQTPDLSSVNVNTHIPKKTYPDSDSSDDAIIVRNILTKMTDSKTTSISHPILSCPPILTNGEITPKVIWDFENHCATFFMNAKDGVADDKKVTCILGCFENSLVDDWAQVDCDRLAELTFPKFMKEFREHWLPHNWEQTV